MGNQRPGPEPDRAVPDVDDLLSSVVQAIGGQARQGQIRMARAVAEALNGDSGHLLAQAGTGTGKSLAYCVPAAAHAVAVGEPVVVSTATLALQRQLVEKDLPAVAAAMAPALGREPTFAVLKGRGNYICLDRLNRDTALEAPDGLFETSASRLGRQARRLRDWAASTPTGDRDDLDAPVDGRVWSAVSISARECPGALHCLYGKDCFVESARERCRSVDLVVTNHAMLAVHIQGDASVMPQHCAVVIDEAHELVDRMTTALTRELSEGSVSAAVRRAGRFIGDELSDQINDCAGFLADVLRQATPGRLRQCTGELLVALTALRDATHDAQAALKSDPEDDPQAQGDRIRARGLVNAVNNVAGSLITLDGSTVAWVEGVPGKEAVLKVAPLSVRDMLEKNLFDQAPVVLTSATLAVAGDFEKVAETLGCAEPWLGIDAGSPFDYGRQGILYCAAHLPRPGRDGVSEGALQELGDLVEAAGGRTLALFSSWRGVDRAHEELVGRFTAAGGPRILRASRGEPVAAVVRQFAEDPRACLLGTLSLWQGVDVAGGTCILVTIDRLPFPRPDEPLVAARQEHVDSQGGDGFRSVSVPRAALMLAQGSGRLIRSQDDRGVVAVLDPRLATASYGRDLRNSMPPLWPTTNREMVLAALRRLDQQLSDDISSEHDR